MSKMIQLLLKPHLLLLVAVIGWSCASSKKENRPSPYAMDSTEIENVKLKIAYSSPGVKKRKIWGELVPYGNMWRTGANEATTLEVSEDIILAGQPLPKGKYAIFTIPESNKWTLLFNSEWSQWGAYNYDNSKDALVLEVVPEKVKDLQERMRFYFEEDKLKFHWEYLTFSLDISAKE